MSDLLNELKNQKLITICRGIYGDDLIQLVKALKEGGIKFVEVTFDQNDENCILNTCNAIKNISDEFKGSINVGAGTVISTEQVIKAKEAGAKYIISPNVDESIIRETKKNGLLSIPGAMTPTEIISADKFGADLVKVFPVRGLGTEYIKDIKGPINFIDLVATAGVTKSNLTEYLDVGFSGVGISGYLTDKSLIKAGNFEEIKRRAEVLVHIVQEKE